jgi:hypothetical protein
MQRKQSNEEHGDWQRFFIHWDGGPGRAKTKREQSRLRRRICISQPAYLISEVGSGHEAKKTSRLLKKTGPRFAWRGWPFPLQSSFGRRMHRSFVLLLPRPLGGCARAVVLPAPGRAGIESRRGKAEPFGYGEERSIDFSDGAPSADRRACGERAQERRSGGGVGVAEL